LPVSVILIALTIFILIIRTYFSYDKNNISITFSYIFFQYC
jgi:hypothetical protein